MEILLAEDNEDNYLVIKSNLRRVKDVNLKWLKDGLEAKKALENGYKPDIFLLDIQMPNIDGVTLGKWIREQKRFKDSCIIAITASVFPEMIDKYMDNGIDYILEKPFARKSFLELISKCNDKLNEKIEIINTILKTSTIDSIPTFEHFIDLKKVASEWGFEDDEMINFVNKFIKKVNEYSIELYEAIKIGNYDKINAISHSMKSSVGNLRLNKIYDFLSELEVLSNNRLLREDINFEVKYKELEEMLNSIKF